MFISDKFIPMDMNNKGVEFALETIVKYVFILLTMIVLIFLIYQWQSQGTSMVDYFFKIFG